eukprot:1475097-Pyramimonas_sp.AAC.1
MVNKDRRPRRRSMLDGGCAHNGPPGEQLPAHLARDEKERRGCGPRWPCAFQALRGLEEAGAHQN